nr:lamin tail domain-containing protein [Rhodopirellula sp. SM50]
MLARSFQLLVLVACLFSAANARAGLVITEVMFNPFADPFSIDPDTAPNEWIELFNTGPGTIDLSEYKLVDGNGDSFGAMSGSLASNESIVVYNSDFAQIGPTDFDYSLFSTKWGLDASVKTLALTSWQPMSDPLIDPSESKTLKLLSLVPTETTVVSLEDFANDVTKDWPTPVEAYSMYLSDLSNPSPDKWFTIDALTPGFVDSEQGDFGSPGYVEFSAAPPTVPEPHSMAVFALLTCSVTMYRRRRSNS